MKTCTNCGESKPLDGGFHRHKRSRDGRQARCKSCVKAYQAEHYRRNRDAVRAQSAEYYRRNRDAVLARKAEYNVEYFAANPHRRWVGVYQQRAKKYGFETVIEPFTKDELVARWGESCWHCGGPFEQLDHYPVAVINGGSHTLENCRPSCTPCNAKGRVIRRTNTNETENQK